MQYTRTPPPARSPPRLPGPPLPFHLPARLRPLLTLTLILTQTQTLILTLSPGLERQLGGGR